MDWYRLALFVHVIAVAGLFASLAIEWVSLRSLRRATSYEQAREWIQVWSLLPAIGGPSVFVALASGVYLATTLGAWRLGWVAVAVPTLVLAAVAGALTAPSRNRVRVTIGSQVGSMPQDVRVQLTLPEWLRSLRLRTALFCGLVFEMTVKPEAGAWVMVGAAVLGLVWDLAARGSATPAHPELRTESPRASGRL